MGCCSPKNNNNMCDSECCGILDESQIIEDSKIKIDFLYLDLDICNRCQGTDEGLDEAIADVQKVLKMTGRKVIVNKIHIDNKEMAIQHKFFSSPTIRINNKDIQREVRESLCESCGDLCGDDVDCRVWLYKGKEYTTPPKAMIVDAILGEVYGNNKILLDNKELYRLPENLKNYFKSLEKTRT